MNRTPQTLDVFDFDTYLMPGVTMIMVLTCCFLYEKFPHMVTVALFGFAGVRWFQNLEGEAGRKHEVRVLPVLFMVAMWFALGDSAQFMFSPVGEVLIRDAFMLVFVVINYIRVQPGFEIAWACILIAGMAFPTEDSTPVKMDVLVLGLKAMGAALVFVLSDMSLKTGLEVCKKKKTTYAEDARFNVAQSAWILFVSKYLSILSVLQVVFLVRKIVSNRVVVRKRDDYDPYNHESPHSHGHAHPQRHRAAGQQSQYYDSSGSPRPNQRQDPAPPSVYPATPTYPPQSSAPSANRVGSGGRLKQMIGRTSFSTDGAGTQVSGFE